MNRRSIATLCLLALAAPAHATNFLLIVVDDLGFDKVGVYEATAWPSGTPMYLPATPTLDALAGQGMYFTNVYASPVCSPTRAGILTGRYSYEHDVAKTVNETSPDLASDEVTLAEVLADPTYTPDPYTSGVIGKWHLGTSSAGGTDWSVPGEYADAPNPIGQGFSTYLGVLEGEPEDWYEWLEVRYPEDLTSGGVGGTVAWSETYASEPTFVDTYDWITAQTGPWFALVALNVAHADDAYDAASYEEDDLPPFTDCQDRDGDGACNDAEIHGGMVEYADQRINDLLVDLAYTDRELLEDTVIVVMGDNGSPDTTIEGGWLASGERRDQGKNTTYESGIRVPLIITRGCDWMDALDGRDDGLYNGSTPACTGTSVPMATPGLAVNARTQVQDLFATVLDLSGSSYTPPSRSFSLVPCLSATSADAADCGDANFTTRRQYTETFRRSFDSAHDYGRSGVAIAGQLALKRGNYKLVGRIDGKGKAACLDHEFYDLGSDPFETDDLRSGGSKMTATQSTNYTQLASYLTKTIAPDWIPASTCR